MSPKRYKDICCSSFQALPWTFGDRYLHVIQIPKHDHALNSWPLSPCVGIITTALYHVSYTLQYPPPSAFSMLLSGKSF